MFIILCSLCLVKHNCETRKFIFVYIFDVNLFFYGLRYLNLCLSVEQHM